LPIEFLDLNLRNAGCFKVVIAPPVWSETVQELKSPSRMKADTFYSRLRKDDGALIRFGRGSSPGELSTAFAQSSARLARK
jgi:hypothetical protein